MIPSTEVMGSVTIEKEVREKARRTILAHDSNAYDIIEILGLRNEVAL